MPVNLPEIRIVLWSGKKFLFMGKEDFRNLTPVTLPSTTEGFIETFMNLSKGGSLPYATDSFGQQYTTDADSDYVRVIPESCSVDTSVDGTASATLTVVLPQYPVNHLEYRKNLPGDSPDKWNNRSHYMHDAGVDDYYEALVSQHLYPNLDIYKKYGVFENDSWNSLDTLESFLGYLFSNTEPLHLFTPPQLIWIMMRKRPDEPWYRSFTGVVNDVSVQEGGTSRKMTVRCSNLLQFITKISMVTQKFSMVGGDFVLETFSEEQRAFLRVYLSTIFNDIESVSMDAVSAITWSRVMSKIAKLVNRSFGSVTEFDAEAMRGVIPTDAFQKRLVDSGWQASAFGLPTSEDVKTYIDFCKSHSFFRFKVIDDRDPKYESNELNDFAYENMSLEAPDKMTLGDLFQLHKMENGAIVSCVSRMCYNKEYRDVEQNQTGGLPSPFQKIVKPMLESFEMPKQMMASSIIRQFASAMMIWIHTDGAGNWVTEIPKWNALPKFFGVDKHSRCINAYSDHDAKYILARPFELTSFTENSSPDSLVTYIQVPFGHNYYQINRKIQSGFYTGRDIDMTNALLFGLNTVAIEQYFTDIGDLAKLGLIENGKANEKGTTFLMKFAKLQREIRNGEVFTASASLVLNPAFQVGRNTFIVHRERLYMVTDVSHSFTSGKGGTTTLTLKYGRPIYGVISEPWKYFIDNIHEINFVEPVSDVNVSTVVATAEPSEDEMKGIATATDTDVMTTEEWQAFYQEGMTGYTQRTLNRGKSENSVPPYTKEEQAKYAGLNVNLLHDMVLFTTQLESYAKSIFPSLTSFGIIPSSGIRMAKDENDKSDHIDGNAVDIGGIRCILPFLNLGSTPTTILFDATKSVDSHEFKFMKKAAEILVGLGYAESNQFRLPGDHSKVVLWNVTNLAEKAKFNSTCDPGHVHHLHVKNTTGKG
mgnify:CR=1 FL=1